MWLYCWPHVSYHLVRWFPRDNRTKMYVYYHLVRWFPDVTTELKCTYIESSWKLLDLSDFPIKNRSVWQDVSVHFILWSNKTCLMSEMWGQNFKKSIYYHYFWGVVPPDTGSHVTVRTVHELILAQPNFSGNKRKLRITTYERNHELNWAHLLDLLLKSLFTNKL